MLRVPRPQLSVLTDEAAGSCDGALGPAASPHRPPWEQPPGHACRPRADGGCPPGRPASPGTHGSLHGGRAHLPMYPGGCPEVQGQVRHGAHIRSLRQAAPALGGGPVVSWSSLAVPGCTLLPISYVSQDRAFLVTSLSLSFLQGPKPMCPARPRSFCPPWKAGSPHKSSGAIVDPPGTSAAVCLALRGRMGKAQSQEGDGGRRGATKCLLTPAPSPPPQTSVLSSPRRDSRSLEEARQVDRSPDACSGSLCLMA